MEVRSTTIGKNKDILYAMVYGEIDLYSASDLKKILSEKIVEESSSNLVLDLDNVVYIDSSGIGALIALVSQLKELGGYMVFVRVKASIVEIFELTKLTSFFTLKDTVQDAVVFLESL